MFSVNWFCTHTTAISQTLHLGSFPSTPLEMYSSLSRTLAMPASLFHAPRILDSLVGIYIVWQIFGNINCYTSILTQGEGRRLTTRSTATMHVFQSVLFTTGNPKLIKINSEFHPRWPTFVQAHWIDTIQFESRLLLDSSVVQPCPEIPRYDDDNTNHTSFCMNNITWILNCAQNLIM
jgi:hypothetical protein